MVHRTDPCPGAGTLLCIEGGHQRLRRRVVADRQRVEIPALGIVLDFLQTDDVGTHSDDRRNQLLGLNRQLIRIVGSAAAERRPVVEDVEGCDEKLTIDVHALRPRLSRGEHHGLVRPNPIVAECVGDGSAQAPRPVTEAEGFLIGEERNRVRVREPRGVVQQQRIGHVGVGEGEHLGAAARILVGGLLDDRHIAQPHLAEAMQVERVGDRQVAGELHEHAFVRLGRGIELLDCQVGWAHPLSATPDDVVDAAQLGEAEELVDLRSDSDHLAD